jgi:hypothetical protein
VDSTKIFDPAKQNVDSSVDQPVAYYTDWDIVIRVRAHRQRLQKDL